MILWLVKKRSVYSAAKIVVTVYPVIASFWLAIETDTIAKSTKLISSSIFNPTKYSIDFETLFFWIFAIFWVLLFNYILSYEKRDRLERTEKLVGSIHHIPNINAYKYYPDLYDEVQKILFENEESLIATSSNDDVAIDDVANQIKKVLKCIVKLTGYFSRVENTKYGANIMLLFSPKTDSYLVDKIKNSLHFSEGKNINSLLAVLHMPEELVINNDGFSAFSLPVPYKTRINGCRVALPGAPFAALNGDMYLETKRKLMDDLMDFDKLTKNEIEEYFNKGQGKSINSFASFRIGTSKRPIGILNLDCSEPYLLGGDEEFYPTFYTLLYPLMKSMSNHIDRFASLYKINLLNSNK